MRTPPQFIVTSLLYLLVTRQKYTLFASNKTFICSHVSLFGLCAVFQKVREAKIFRSFYRAWIICFLNSIFFAIIVKSMQQTSCLLHLTLEAHQIVLL